MFHIVTLKQDPDPVSEALGLCLFFGHGKRPSCNA